MNIGGVTSFVLCGLVLAGPPVTATQSAPPDVEGLRCIQAFLSAPNQLRRYRAIRRLEGQGAGLGGWLQAWTELTPETGFQYGIIAEGGSDSIRSRVLRRVLDGEKQFFLAGNSERANLSPVDYDLQYLGRDEGGLVRLSVAPRHPDVMLAGGAIFLQPDDGSLARLEGTLAKNPSFWVRHVEIVRRYQRVNGTVVPTQLDSTAQVRWFGPSTFRMTYQYELINGSPVTPAP